MTAPIDEEEAASLTSDSHLSEAASPTNSNNSRSSLNVRLQALTLQSDSGSLEDESTIMAFTMEANLSSLLKDIIKDLPNLPVHKSFAKMDIASTQDLLQADDPILDTLSYNVNVTTTVVTAMKLRKIKNLHEAVMIPSVYLLQRTFLPN